MSITVPVDRKPDLGEESPSRQRRGTGSTPGGTPDGTLARWQWKFTARHVVGAECVTAGAVIAVRVFDGPWWVWAVVGALALLVATLAYRDATLVGWIARALRWRRRTRNEKAWRAAVAIPEAFSVELPGVGPVGMRWDGQYAITMIGLHGRSYAPSVLAAEGVEGTDTVPLDVAGQLLRQFGGLELHSVDVVAVGRRTAEDGRYTPRYDEIIGDRPAVGERRTWLVLRLAPQACLRALAYRGDVAVAVAAATERVRQAAVRAGCRAVTCGVEQISAADGALLDGLDLTHAEERWSDLRVGSDYVTSYRIAGRDLSTRLLNDLWTIRATTTVTVVRLKREDGEQVSMGALVRVHTRGALPHPPLSTTHSTPGQSLPAVLASLPLGDRSLELALSPTAGGAEAKALAVPIGPTGVLLGMARSGVPYLMPLTDPLRFTRIAVSADLTVVQSLVLRASATGAVVLIHTDRPQLWAPICDEYRIELAYRGQPRITPTVVVADGQEAQQLLVSTGERGHALVSLTGSPAVDCDIVIRQISEAEVVVSTPGRDIPLGIMRPRNEAQAVAHLRGLRGRQ
jgi:type VII secretion protein EccE